MDLMWNYDLEGAKRLLEPWRGTLAWHAGAYAECFALRVVLTGRRSDAAATLELVCTAEVLCEALEAKAEGAAQQILAAELLLLRSGLQLLLGARFRAAFNLRQCWGAYRRLEQRLGAQADWPAERESALQPEDLRGRLCFGLGVFYLATSLLPVGLSPLARLAGFVVHRPQGKAYLAECAEQGLGPRATLAAILLSLYHLDIEPDVRRAGELLVASLGQRPENVLLHWSGSFLAWRNTCIAQALEMTDKALWCCGEELGGKAIYLRYELGTLRFIAMDWPGAQPHLRFVHESVRAGGVFFPHAVVVAAQLAAVAFSLGEEEEGERLCREAAVPREALASLRLEADLVELLQLFLRRRREARALLAFEVMYLLRQLSRAPAALLRKILARLAELTPPVPSELAAEAQRLMDACGPRAVRCVLLFYLGEAQTAAADAPELAALCARLPAWGTYLAAHGLYWCGRVLALSGQRAAALRCLREARARRRYPFDIHDKICKVIEETEAMPSG